MTQTKTGKKPILRKCAGCMEYKEKKNLYRFYKTVTGEICIDETFKSGGRGAYICRTTECLEKAFKRHALEHSFKMKIKKEEYDKLAELIKTREDKYD